MANVVLGNNQYRGAANLSLQVLRIHDDDWFNEWDPSPADPPIRLFHAEASAQVASYLQSVMSVEAARNACRG